MTSESPNQLTPGRKPKTPGSTLQKDSEHFFYITPDDKEKLHEVKEVLKEQNYTMHLEDSLMYSQML